MSSIVGFIYNSKVYIGADSAGSDVSNNSIRDMPNQKIFTNGELLFGVAGSIRVGQILRYGFTPPIHPEEISDKQYICSTLVRSIMESLLENNYKIDGNEDVSFDGQLMIGYKSQLYVINSDFGILYDSQFDAIGCGSEYAMSSIYTSLELSKQYNFEIKPETIVQLALQASAKYAIGVRGPFVIHTN